MKMNILSGFWGIKSRTGDDQTPRFASRRRRSPPTTIRSTSPYWRGMKWAIAGAVATAVFLSNGIPFDKNSEKYKALDIIDGKPEAKVYLKNFIEAKEWRYKWGDNPYFTFRGQISPHFHEKITEGWNKIPKAFKELIQENGCEQIFTPMMQLELRAQIGVFDPTDPRTLPNHLSGFFGVPAYDRKRIIVSEYELLNRSWEDQSKDTHPTAEGLSGDKKTGVISWIPNQNIQETLWHETGHAVNSAIEDYIGSLVSDTPAFIDAYNADLAQLGSPEQITKLGYDYFANPEKDKTKTRDETFAEMYAQKIGGSKIGQRMETDWPNISLYMDRFISGFEKASELSLKEKIQFIDKLDGKSNDPNKVRPSVSNPWLLELRRKSLDSEWLKDYKDWRDASSGNILSGVIQTTLTHFYNDVGYTVDNTSSYNGAIRPQEKSSTLTKSPKL